MYRTEQLQLPLCSNYIPKKLIGNETILSIIRISSAGHERTDIVLFLQGLVY